MEQAHPQEHEGPGTVAVVATPASPAQAQVPKPVANKDHASKQAGSKAVQS